MVGGGGSLVLFCDVLCATAVAASIAAPHNGIRPRRCTLLDRGKDLNKTDSLPKNVTSAHQRGASKKDCRCRMSHFRIHAPLTGKRTPQPSAADSSAHRLSAHRRSADRF